MNEPELLSRREDGTELAMALWRFGSPLLALSSAPYGGGWGERRWVLAAQVAGGYSRSDPAGHLAELARGLDLAGPGIGMLTAVDVRQVSMPIPGPSRSRLRASSARWPAGSDRL